MDAGFALLLQVLPLAIGAALSPAILTAQILVLAGGPGSLVRGWALAIGRMSALFLFSFGGLSLLAMLPDFSTGMPSGFEAALFVVAGLFLLVLAYFEWWRRGRKSKPPSTRGSRFTDKLVDANPVYLFLFGAGWMLVNVSTLALYIPALHIITSSASNLVAKLLVFVVLFVITSAVVLVPTLAVTIFGDRAQRILANVHRWLDRHSHQVVIAVSGLFGVLLIVVGLHAFISL